MFTGFLMTCESGSYFISRVSSVSNINLLNIRWPVNSLWDNNLIRPTIMRDETEYFDTTVWSLLLLNLGYQCSLDVFCLLA